MSICKQPAHLGFFQSRGADEGRVALKFVTLMLRSVSILHQLWDDVKFVFFYFCWQTLVCLCARTCIVQCVFIVYLSLSFILLFCLFCFFPCSWFWHISVQKKTKNKKKLFVTFSRFSLNGFGESFLLTSLNGSFPIIEVSEWSIVSKWLRVCENSRLNTMQHLFSRHWARNSIELQLKSVYS